MNNKVNDSHEDWMKRKVESEAEKVESGRARFITNSEVKQVMRAKRAIAASVREPLFDVLCGWAKEDA